MRSGVRQRDEVPGAIRDRPRVVEIAKRERQVHRKLPDKLGVRSFQNGLWKQRSYARCSECSSSHALSAAHSVSEMNP